MRENLRWRNSQRLGEKGGRGGGGMISYRARLCLLQRGEPTEVGGGASLESIESNREVEHGSLMTLLICSRGGGYVGGMTDIGDTKSARCGGGFGGFFALIKVLQRTAEA